MTIAQRVIDGLGEGFTDYAGDLLPGLVAALVADAEPIDTLVAGIDGWGLAFDLDNTPVPGWLGQLAGVTPIGGTLQSQRDRVRARGYARGTVAGIRATLLPLLKRADGHGGEMPPRLLILERTAADGSPDAYGFQVQVYAAQADTATQSAIRTAVDAVRPAGLLWNLRVLSGWTYDQSTEIGGTNYAAETAEGLTYDQDTATVPDLSGLAVYNDDQGRANYATETRHSYDDDRLAAQ